MAERYFSFIISGQECAIDSDRIVEVVSNILITSLPLTPDYVTGVANFRGEIISIVDLAFFLGQGKATKDCVYIICSSPQGQVAIVVDSIRDTFIPDKIMSTEEIGAEINLPHFVGVVMNEKGLIRILDIDTILKKINGSQVTQQKIPSEVGQI